MSDEFSALANMAAGSFSDTQQMFLQKRSNDIDYATWMKQQNVLNRMALENRRTEAQDYVEGLKAAGFSPALAAKGNFTPVAMSAPQKSSGVPQMPSVNMAAMYEATIHGQVAASEINKNNAEADLLRSQATGQGIANDRMTQEDVTSRTLVQTQIHSFLNDPVVQKNPELSAAFSQMLDASNMNKFNLGTLRANQEFFKTVSEGNAAAIQKVKNVLENMSVEAFIQAGIPEAQVSIIKQQIMLNHANLIKASADAALAYSNIALNADKSKELLSQAAKNLSEANYMYSKDAVSQWKSGDYTALAVNIATGAINAAAGSAGFGAGTAIAGKIAGKTIGVANDGKAVSGTAFNAGQRLKNITVGPPKGMDYGKWRKHYGVPDTPAFKQQYNNYLRDSSKGMPRSR